MQADTYIDELLEIFLTLSMKTVQVHLIIGTTLVKSSFRAAMLIELKIAVGFLKITFYSFEKVTSLLDEKVCVFSLIASKSLKSSLFNIFLNKTRISRKVRRHMFTNRFLSFPRMPCSSHSCNDRKYSYFARNVCNRYVDSFKTSSEHDCKHVVRLLRLIKIYLDKA